MHLLLDQTRVEHSRYIIHHTPVLRKEHTGRRIDLVCIECRDTDHLPLIIWSSESAGMTAVLLAMARHETTLHPRKPVPAGAAA